MVSTPFAVAFLAHCASFAALVQLMSSLDHPLGAMTWSEAAQVLMPLVAMAGLLAAVASIYGRLHRAAAAAASGAGTEVAVAILCAAVCLLVNSFVCETPVERDGDGAARTWEELGLAAAHVLPAAAMATFFLGVALLFVHLCAGGGCEVQILIKIVLGATALLVGLMALAEAH